MVSFQSPFFHLNQRNSILESDNKNSSKKRKWDHDPAMPEGLLPFKQLICPKVLPTTTRSFSDLELHLETPLPSDWQRCLDIQSGEIYFYNTRTQKRTVRDPREGPEPTSPRDYHMSLDLELNLPCGSLNHKSSHESNSVLNKKNSASPPRSPAADQRKSPSDGSKAVEMVAAACMRCHMLVVLQKSSPTCPNCKFVHPPYQSPPDLFKPKLSLSC